MEAAKFDSLTRLFAHQMPRRHVLKAASALVAAAAVPVKIGRAQSQSDASTLVQRFYENIDAYQYKQAYALVGSKWQSEQSLDTFTKGYSKTGFVACITTGEKASGANTVVSVNLVSWHNDGNVVFYEGSYTVGKENGKLLILAGDNTPVTIHAKPGPLCKISDVKFAFGRWNGGAGNAFGSIVGTNTGSETCILGGVPRVIIKDTHKYVLESTSSEGSPPQAAVLNTGQSAHAPLRFANWCADSKDPVSVYVEIAADKHDGTVDASANGISFPPCLGQGQPALLELKGWVNGAQQ